MKKNYLQIESYYRTIQLKLRILQPEFGKNNFFEVFTSNQKTWSVAPIFYKSSKNYKFFGNKIIRVSLQRGLEIAKHHLGYQNQGKFELISSYYYILLCWRDSFLIFSLRQGFFLSSKIKVFRSSKYSDLENPNRLFWHPHLQLILL